MISQAICAHCCVAVASDRLTIVSQSFLQLSHTSCLRHKHRPRIGRLFHHIIGFMPASILIGVHSLLADAQRLQEAAGLLLRLLRRRLRAVGRRLGAARHL